MLALRIRQMGRGHWMSFFTLILLGWGGLFAMSVPPELRALEGIYGAELIAALCGGLIGTESFAAAFWMWAVMSAAMMAPTALPAFATYDDLSTTSAPTDFAPLVAGYLAVWLAFAAVAALAQVLLFRAGLISALGQSVSMPLTSALLIGAGLYQFSALKEACLSRCRHPLTFFMQHWDEGAFRNGLRLGAECLGCCWALMALAFVGGTMNLIFMGLAMVLMTLEKLPDIGRYLTKPVGGVLVATGLLLPFI